MGNTVFYKNVQSEEKKINWKDILSESFQRHSKEEFDYAMTSGTAINTANEDDMLRKWHKPWLFVRIGIVGIALMLFVYIMYAIVSKVGFMAPIIELLTIFVPPIVIPLAVICFFWELNIPKNISIFNLLGGFFVGGVASLVITLVLQKILNVPLENMALGLMKSWNLPFESMPNDVLNFLFKAADAVLAPVTEEPGKFLAAIIVISFYCFASKKKVYGLSALVLGAAVGAGFSAFETVQYVFNGYFSAEVGQNISANYSVMWSRLLGSFGCHTLWCASYSAALGLACDKGKKLGIKSFAKINIWIYFAIAFISHAIWNGTSAYSSYKLIKELYTNYDITEQQLDQILSGVNLIGNIVRIILVILQWWVILKLVNKCLEQAIGIGHYQSGTSISYSDQIKDIKAASNGQNLVNAAPGQPVAQVPQAPVAPQVQAPYAPVNQPVAPAFDFVQPIRLSCTGGFLSGKEWNVKGNGRITFGRSDDCLVKFETAAAGVSRMHCEIYYNGNSWCVRDLNSTNGTSVNGVKLPAGGEQALNDGDVISLSNSGQDFALKYI